MGATNTMKYIAENGDDWIVELDIQLKSIREAAQTLIDLIDSDLADFAPKEMEEED